MIIYIHNKIVSATRHKIEVCLIKCLCSQYIQYQWYRKRNFLSLNSLREQSKSKLHYPSKPLVLFLLNMGLLFSIKIIIPLYYFFLINVGFSKPTSLWILILILSWIGLNKFQPYKFFIVSSTSGTINEYKVIHELLCWIWLFNHITYIFFQKSLSLSSITIFHSWCYN